MRCFCAQVASLEKLLLAQLAALPGGASLAPPGCRLRLSESGDEAPAWATLGTLRARCDARGDPLCVAYCRTDAQPMGW